jgi:1,2-diacylglycerol 3-alpha-glucosyltransferase
MAAGLPVLVSARCGSVQDLVREGLNGFVFDPYNVDTIAQLMLRVTQSSADRRAMADTSQEIVAAWGLGRFVSGLSDAAQAALAGKFQRRRALSRLLAGGLVRL